MVYYVLRFISFLILKIFFRLEKKGTEHIPKRGGFIIASNHVSHVDPVVVGVACPRELSYMARHDLFFSRFLGWLLYNCHSFPVKRNSPDLSALKEAMRRVKRGRGLVIFPEGTRGTEGIPGEPQPGIGFLAAKLGVPVVPAFIKGTETALPKGAHRLRPSKIRVSFGGQIRAEHGASYQDTARLIMANIRRLSY